MIKLRSLIPLREAYASDLEENPYSFLQKHCPIALKNYKVGNILWRGDKGIKQPATLISPAKAGAPRLSKDTYNAYVAYMKASPAWRKYPDRMWSIICGGKETAKDFSGVANLYAVFPVGDPQFAVARGADFIKVEIDTGNKDDEVAVWAFDNALHGIMRGIPPYADRDQFRHLLHAGIESMKNHNEPLPPQPGDFRAATDNISDIILKASSVEEAEKTIYRLFTPQSSKTKLMNYSKMNGLDMDEECWTEGDCVIINSAAIDDVFADGEDEQGNVL